MVNNWRFTAFRFRFCSVALLGSLLAALGSTACNEFTGPDSSREIYDRLVFCGRVMRGALPETGSATFRAQILNASGLIDRVWTATIGADGRACTEFDLSSDNSRLSEVKVESLSVDTQVGRAAGQVVRIDSIVRRQVEHNSKLSVSTTDTYYAVVIEAEFDLLRPTLAVGANNRAKLLWHFVQGRARSQLGVSGSSSLDGLDAGL